MIVVVVDTDILIDAGRNVNEALSCLLQIEQKYSVILILSSNNQD